MVTAHPQTVTIDLETHRKLVPYGKVVCLHAGAGRTWVLKRPLLQQNLSAATRCSLHLRDCSSNRIVVKKPVLRFVYSKQVINAENRWGEKRNVLKE